MLGSGKSFEHSWIYRHLRNLFQPRHMMSACSKFNFGLPYESYFGGVSAMTPQQYLAINGFSNVYYGWGGEDDDLYSRTVQAGFHMKRTTKAVGM